MEPKRLTNDHKPNREDEAKRIRALPNGLVQLCNGVWRVLVRTGGPHGPGHNFMGLAVSRAMGDLPFKEHGHDYISAVPEICHFVVDREEDKFLVLGSDGRDCYVGGG